MYVCMYVCMYTYTKLYFTFLFFCTCWVVWPPDNHHQLRVWQLLPYRPVDRVFRYSIFWSIPWYSGKQQNSCWMVIPPTMVLIGFDPSPRVIIYHHIPFSYLRISSWHFLRPHCLRAAPRVVVELLFITFHFLQMNGLLTARNGLGPHPHQVAIFTGSPQLSAWQEGCATAKRSGGMTRSCNISTPSFLPRNKRNKAARSAWEARSWPTFGNHGRQ